MAASDMKTYTYEAADKSGKIVKGKMEATSEAAVAQRLMANGGQPMSITQVNTGGLNSEISIPGISDKISLKEIAIMSRQLATMINAGLSCCELSQS